MKCRSTEVQTWGTHRTDRAQTKKVGGHWVPQLRSLPAILARGLRIRPAHSPVPPTLNWLVDKSMVAVPNTVRGRGGRDRQKYDEAVQTFRQRRAAGHRIPAGRCSTGRQISESTGVL